jgi:AraC-like DNA-binding protein
VRTVVEQRFAERLTLDDLARETGFSKFYLERSFNERYGLPIHQFLKRVRIARALALLRQGERPASVARAVGFADQPHLTRVFRSELGFTPRQYWATARRN